MRHVGDTERRARLARRHALAPAHRVTDPLSATRAMTVLHATEPATVYLSLLARVDALTPAQVDRALYDDRTLVKQLAMRRTLFVFPRDLLPAAWGSASARVAAAHGTRLAKEVVAGGLADDGAAWLARAREAALAHLAEGVELSAGELRTQVPALAGHLTYTPDKSYGGSVPVAPRVLTQLGAEGRIVRARNTGHWRLARYTWTSMESWLGDVPEPLPPHHGYAELVRRWLATFGPGSAADLQWWLGATKGAVTRALSDVAAVEVALDGGTGWVLRDDLDPVAAVEPWVALLPVLDPTVMGWKERAFYLGEHGPQLFDRNGNAGTTAWWDGRIVGCWVQDPDGVVVVRTLEPVPAEGRRALDVEAARLTEWLDGQRVSTVYPSRAMKEPR
jgi:hypothetical protein